MTNARGNLAELSLMNVAYTRATAHHQETSIARPAAAAAAAADDWRLGRDGCWRD